MATIEDVFIGTELKLNVHIDRIENITMDDYDFSVDLYCSPKNTINIPKSKAVRIDSENYIVLLDTTLVGAGSLKAKITSYIPDDDFDDGYRTVVIMMNTNINIVKSL